MHSNCLKRIRMAKISLSLWLVLALLLCLFDKQKLSDLRPCLWKASLWFWVLRNFPLFRDHYSILNFKTSFTFAFKLWAPVKLLSLRCNFWNVVWIFPLWVTDCSEDICWRASLCSWIDNSVFVVFLQIYHSVSGLSILIVSLHKRHLLLLYCHIQRGLANLKL